MCTLRFLICMMPLFRRFLSIITNEPIPESILIWLFRTDFISLISVLVSEILSRNVIAVFNMCVLKISLPIFENLDILESRVYGDFLKNCKCIFGHIHATPHNSTLQYIEKQTSGY